MKKTFLLILMALSLFSFTSCEKETVLADNQTPSEIKTYVQTHFSDHSILQVIKDKDEFELTYNVMLSDRITLEFNRKKEIIDIDSKNDLKLPGSVIPEKILVYVQSNYPSFYIVGWEVSDRTNQKVELNNDLELIFNKNGDFLRLDD